MNGLSDNDIIQGLIAHDNKTLKYVYEQYMPAIKAYVQRNGGNEDDAIDLFQDGLMALYNNIVSKGYEKKEHTKLSTYFVQICKYKWLDNRKSARVKRNEAIDSRDFEMNDPGISESIEQAEKHKQLHQLIDLLGTKCKELLSLFYWEELSIAEIAEKQNMEAASVKNGKYRCMQKLKEKAIVYLT
jgi:RNA polymerase sigma factor (sigma-70 family)